MLNACIRNIKSFLEGLGEISFPNVCVCCGLETTGRKRRLCSFCKEERFIDANPDNDISSGDIVLPEGVVLQQALWEFDKGGVLQELMHYLKYERLTDIGIELGSLMALRALKHPVIRKKIDLKGAIMVPVPLHYLKFRSRGFNQAFYLAKGVAQIFNISICSHKAVVRTRNTRSQTGLTLSKRISNIKDAFEVKGKHLFKGKTILIIDDVFTTGSTTFELAGALMEAGSGDILIMTAAQA